VLIECPRACNSILNQLWAQAPGSFRNLALRVLTALKDGKPRSFTALLSEVGFSHNTLQQHLERLMAQGLIVREKATANGFGRPKFAYHVPFRTTKHSLALQDPHVELVALPFSRLRHVCRFEKGGYCKETKRNCAPQICPQIRK
jgi:predicted ArsR family transcriptional regulator